MAEYGTILWEGRGGGGGGEGEEGAPGEGGSVAPPEGEEPLGPVAVAQPAQRVPQPVVPLLAGLEEDLRPVEGAGEEVGEVGVVDEVEEPAPVQRRDDGLGAAPSDPPGGQAGQDPRSVAQLALLHLLSPLRSAHLLPPLPFPLLLTHHLTVTVTTISLHHPDSAS